MRKCARVPLRVSARAAGGGDGRDSSGAGSGVLNGGGVNDGKHIGDIKVWQGFDASKE